MYTRLVIHWFHSYLPKRMNTNVHKMTFMSLLIAALTTKAPNWEKLNCQLWEVINISRPIQWHIAQQLKNKLLMHTRTWINLRNIMLRQRNQNTDSKKAIILFIWNSRKEKSMKQVKKCVGECLEQGIRKFFDVTKIF